MRIIFSRKGFDSSAGGCPSPISDGIPISLPIPTQKRSDTTYDHLGLGKIVEGATKGRLTGANLCHNDPMFEAGRCAFGQTGAAQAHLQNNGISVGDVFLFFGLFSEPDQRDPHHRIFGYLRVQEIHAIGAAPSAAMQPAGFSRPHPHTIGDWNTNNSLYVGAGRMAQHVSDSLRLSRAGERVSCWRIPPWLRSAGLTYHTRPDRWDGDETLHVVARGQEFISNVSGSAEAAAWLDETIEAINSEPNAAIR